MKMTLKAMVGVLLCVGILLAGCSTMEKGQPSRLVIRNVSVITMDPADEIDGQGDILENRTLIIEDGIILDNIPSVSYLEHPNDQIIDGEGKFVIPGLIDMHVHLWDENELVLYVANGVTTVRGLGEAPDPELFPESFAAGHQYENNTVEIRNDVLSGKRLGPDMYLAGHLLDGPIATVPGLTMPIADISEIPDIVKNEAETGYEYIKIYDNIPLEYYRIIVQAAENEGLKVIGHKPLDLSLVDAIGSDLYSNEHLTLFRNPDEVVPLLHSGEFPDLAARIAATGMWHCPTLVTYTHVLNPEIPEFEIFFDDANWEYLHPETKDRVRSFLTSVEYEVYMGEYLDMYFIPILQILNAVDAPILLGSDAPFAIPGFSAHEELDIMVNRVGMEPYQALKTATVNGALSLGRFDYFGSISEGKRADLLLLNKNPLKDIRNTRDIYGVVLRGQWISDEERKELLQDLK